MIPFFWNILLALIWAGASGTFAFPNLLFGFACGYLILLVAAPLIGSGRYVRRVAQIGRLLLFFLGELLASNLRVAAEVITPRHHMQPAIVGVPLDARSDVELLLLTSMITLTPGNLALEIAPDRSVLYVHGMYVADPERFRRRIKDTFERAVLRVTR